MTPSSSSSSSAPGNDASKADGALGTGNDNAADWKAQKAQQAEARKKANDLKKCEDRIEQIENRISEIDEKMSEPDIATNSGKLNELSKERTALETELEELMEKWEALS